MRSLGFGGVIIFQLSLITTGSLGGSESRDKWKLSYTLSLMRERSLRVGVSNPGASDA